MLVEESKSWVDWESGTSIFVVFIIVIVMKEQKDISKPNLFIVAGCKVVYFCCEVEHINMASVRVDSLLGPQVATAGFGNSKFASFFRYYSPKLFVGTLLQISTY